MEGNLAEVMQRFTAYDEVVEVLSSGEKRASVVLKCGMQVDLRIIAKESYGAALQYFTGSKSHNIAIRRIAQKLGLKINEYGVFRNDKRIAGEDEESVYRAIGLSYIPPELREDRGEFERDIPTLITLDDLQGDLQMHTTWSDGKTSVEEMARAARSRGSRTALSRSSRSTRAWTSSAIAYTITSVNWNVR